MTSSQTKYEQTRNYLDTWQDALKQNPYLTDEAFRHSIDYYFTDVKLKAELTQFGQNVVEKLESLVAENNYRLNLPRLEKYNGIGERIEKIIHHPSYVEAGNIIYGSKMLARLAKKGGLLEALSFFFLSGQAGEAGHNCPFACSAGIVRVLQKVDNVPKSQFYIEKLCIPSFQENFTGAQFLTEIQGGSDVGQNACEARLSEEGVWQIFGEKWFCSNANADLILMTARFNNEKGTAGLALFLVPKLLESKLHNHYGIRRLKEKIGTCSMASGEIDFHGAVAYPVGRLEDGFKLVMENVLHLSRLCNTFCVLGMGRRAYAIALAYSKVRVAFGKPIFHYPLVKENLAIIKVESDAMLASAFATTALQDKLDLTENPEPSRRLLLRLLANLNKYISALWTVSHIHHAIDVLAGNGAIETFSSLPRLLKDSIVCENWEGTHNTLRMQILRDVHKYQVDAILFAHVESLLEPLAPSPQKEVISDYLQKVKAKCEQCKVADMSLQSLLIKEVVDQFSYLYLALSLLLEAIDQKTLTACESKLDSFNLFVRLHLTPINDVDADYLALIEQVVM